MALNLEAFISGITHSVKKKAEDINHEQVINSSIFPTIESQHTWKFAKSNNRLHLHDGNVVHTFVAEHIKDDEDFPITKTHDTSYFDFDKDMQHTGTAQVHKANPGMLYVTLHDGEKNPTYTFTHVSENSWRASPKIKHKVAIDIPVFQKALNEKLAFDFINKLTELGHKGIAGIQALGEDPKKSALGGLALGGAYDLGRRWLYNTPEENDEETLGQRATRWLAPAAAAGGVGLLERSLIPHHYAGGAINDLTNPQARLPNNIPGK